MNQESYLKTGASYQLMVVAMQSVQFKSMKWSPAVMVDRLVLSSTSATLTRMSAQGDLHQGQWSLLISPMRNWAQYYGKVMKFRSESVDPPSVWSFTLIFNEGEVVSHYLLLTLLVRLTGMFVLTRPLEQIKSWGTYVKQIAAWGTYVKQIAACWLGCRCQSSCWWKAASFSVWQCLC